MVCYSPDGLKPTFIVYQANRAPLSSDKIKPDGSPFNPGDMWADNSQSPIDLYFYRGGGSWEANQVTISTDGTFASPSNTEVPSTLATKTYVDAVASLNVANKTNADSPYDVLGTDYVIACDTSAGAITIKLPLAPTDGQSYWIYDVGGAVALNNITINGNGKNIVGGGASAGSKVLSVAYSGAYLVWNNSANTWMYRYSA